MKTTTQQSESGSGLNQIATKETKHQKANRLHCEWIAKREAMTPEQRAADDKSKADQREHERKSFILAFKEKDTFWTKIIEYMQYPTNASGKRAPNKTIYCKIVNVSRSGMLLHGFCLFGNSVLDSLFRILQPRLCKKTI